MIAAYGSLDVLVNNAGGQFVKPAEEISHNGFRAVMRLNLDAVWELTRLAAVESMLPNGYGKVISVVLSPRRGIPGMFHSSAARAAVESMTRTLATEWGGRGVRLTCVAPGDDRHRGLARLRRQRRGRRRDDPARAARHGHRGRADDRVPRLARPATS